MAEQAGARVQSTGKVLFPQPRMRVSIHETYGFFGTTDGNRVNGKPVMMLLVRGVDIRSTSSDLDMGCSVE